MRRVVPDIQPARGRGGLFGRRGLQGLSEEVRGLAIRGGRLAGVVTAAMVGKLATCPAPVLWGTNRHDLHSTDALLAPRESGPARSLRQLGGLSPPNACD